jgi:hypothetical protein
MLISVLRVQNITNQGHYIDIDLIVSVTNGVVVPS